MKLRHFILLFVSLILALDASVVIAQSTTTQSATTQPAGPDNVDYQLGKHAYKEKNYQQAFVYYQKAAMEGNTTAMAELGDLYITGFVLDGFDDG
ncbi:MAG TPA: hypothetical protein VKJ65_03825 [Phycisphaerae bacterium]|nr:hypothetical protein [Phycisphaerae bacterium]